MATVKLRLRDSLATPRTVVLEPWAHEVVLPAGAMLSLYDAEGVQPF